MANIDLDLSGWPVAVTRPRAGVLLDHELVEYLARFRKEVQKRGGPYVCVVDLRESPVLTPTQRKTISNGMDDANVSQRQCIAAALIFESAVMRGMLTALLWIKQPKHELKVFATVEMAKVWALECLWRHRQRGQGDQVSRG